MSRLHAALLAASFLLPTAAGAQGTETAPPPKETSPKPPAKPGTSAAPSGALAPGGTPAASPPAPGSPELDPVVRDLVRREVEKAKDEMRDEIRAEIQGAQSAREFMETTAAGERPKLEFLQLNGYLRVRSEERRVGKECR